MKRSHYLLHPLTFQLQIPHVGKHCLLAFIYLNGHTFWGYLQVLFSLNLPFHPFCPWTGRIPPVRIHVSSTACDVIIYNGQGQLCQLTCARCRDLSNHTRKSTIRSKNHAPLTRKFQWKSHSTTPYLSLHLKAFLNSFPNEMKPTKCPAKEKKRRGKKRGGEKVKINDTTAVSLLNSNFSRNFAFCACQNFASPYVASGSEVCHRLLRRQVLL